MTQVFTVAVLECDTPFPSAKKAHGSYAEIFRRLLGKGLEILGSDIELVVNKFDVVDAQEYPDLEDFDAFLLTGSKHNAYDDDPWIVKLVGFVSDIISNSSKPVVGICYGHQIIGRALGAKVGVNPLGWEFSVETVNFTEEGQKLFGVSSHQLHQMHRDAVLEVPEGVVNLGFSPRCEVQGLYKPGKVFSLQSHPEFDAEIMTELVQSRHQLKMFDDEQYKDAMSRVATPHAGAMVATKIWEFLLNSKKSETNS